MSATAFTQETVSDLAGKIYDAALDDSLWPRFLESFAEVMQTRGTLLFIHDFASGDAAVDSQAAPFASQAHFDPSYLESLTEHYHHVNVWVQNEQTLPPGRPVTGGMLYPNALLPKTEWYNDWLRPQDYFFAIGGIVERNGPFAVKFTSLRDKRRGEFTAKELAVWEALVPHIRRACTIRRNFSFLRALNVAALAVLDSLPSGVLLLGADWRVLHANLSARTMMARRDGFGVNRNGQVCGVDGASLTGPLRRVVASALNLAMGRVVRHDDIATINRPGGRRMHFVACPLPTERRVEQSNGTFGGFVAALLVYDPETIPKTAASMLRRLYGLTAAEARVAMSVAEGLALSTCADRLGVTRSTVAAQLKSVFQKTYTRRQGELIKLLLLGPTNSILTEIHEG